MAFPPACIRGLPNNPRCHVVPSKRGGSEPATRHRHRHHHAADVATARNRVGRLTRAQGSDPCLAVLARAWRTGLVWAHPRGQARASAPPHPCSANRGSALLAHRRAQTGSKPLVIVRPRSGVVSPAAAAAADNGRCPRGAGSGVQGEEDEGRPPLAALGH